MLFILKFILVRTFIFLFIFSIAILASIFHVYIPHTLRLNVYPVKWDPEGFVHSAGHHMGQGTTNYQGYKVEDWEGTLSFNREHIALSLWLKGVNHVLSEKG